MRHSSERKSVSQGAESLGTPLDAYEVQAALMLIAYRAQHRHDANPPVINLEDLEMGNSSIEIAAGDEWVEEPKGEPSFSSLYRAYVEKHPHERINVRDEHALEDLFEVFSRVRRMSLYRKAKLH